MRKPITPLLTLWLAVGAFLPAPTPASAEESRCKGDAAAIAPTDKPLTVPTESQFNKYYKTPADFSGSKQHPRYKGYSETCDYTVWRFISVVHADRGDGFNKLKREEQNDLLKLAGEEFGKLDEFAQKMLAQAKSIEASEAAYLASDTKPGDRKKVLLSILASTQPAGVQPLTVAYNEAKKVPSLKTGDLIQGMWALHREAAKSPMIRVIVKKETGSQKDWEEMVKEKDDFSENDVKLLDISLTKIDQAAFTEGDKNLYEKAWVAPRKTANAFWAKVSEGGNTLDATIAGLDKQIGDSVAPKDPHEKAKADLVAGLNAQFASGKMTDATSKALFDKYVWKGKHPSTDITRYNEALDGTKGTVGIEKGDDGQEALYYYPKPGVKFKVNDIPANLGKNGGPTAAEFEKTAFDNIAGAVIEGRKGEAKLAGVQKGAKDAASDLTGTMADVAKRMGYASTITPAVEPHTAEEQRSKLANARAERGQELNEQLEGVVKKRSEGRKKAREAYLDCAKKAEESFKKDPAYNTDPRALQKAVDDYVLKTCKVKYDAALAIVEEEHELGVKAMEAKAAKFKQYDSDKELDTLYDKALEDDLVRICKNDLPDSTSSSMDPMGMDYTTSNKMSAVELTRVRWLLEEKYTFAGAKTGKCAMGEPAPWDRKTMNADLKDRVALLLNEIRESAKVKQGGDLGTARLEGTALLKVKARVLAEAQSHYGSVKADPELDKDPDSDTRVNDLRETFTGKKK